MRPATACLGPVDRWEFLRKTTAWAKAACLPLSSLQQCMGTCWLLAAERPFGGAWVGWGMVSGNPQGGVSVVHQASADSDLVTWRKGSTQKRWCFPASCVGGRLNTETMEAVLPALALKPYNSVSPCMSLAPLSLSPSARAQGKCLEYVSLCTDPLRGHLAFQQPFISPRWTEFPLILTDRYGGFSTQHWYFWLGSPVWGLDSSLLRGNLCSWDVYPSSQLLYWVCSQLVSAPHQSRCGFFFISLVLGPIFS